MTHMKDQAARAREPFPAAGVSRRPPALPQLHVSSRQYLLFGGAGAGAGGLRDLVGAFDAEATARDAFRDLRLSPDFRGGWAELVVVQPDGRMKPLCWFGRAPSDPPSLGPPTLAVRRKGSRSRWAVLRRRNTVATARGSSDVD